MKNENFAILTETEEALRNGARLLRAAAAGATALVGKTAEAEKAAISHELLHEALEDLAEQGLFKKADIEPAMARVAEKPDTVVDIVRNIGGMALTARKAAAEARAAEPVGTLVGKKATAAPARKTADMADMWDEAQRKVQDKINRRRG